MRTFINHIKRTLLCIVIIFGIFYGFLNILLSMDDVQQYAKGIAVRELSGLLHTEITIERIQIRPFNKLTLKHVLIPDQRQDTLFYADKVSAGFRWLPLFEKRISFSTIQLLGFDINLYRDNSQTPLNIQFLLDALKSDNKREKEFPFEVNLNSVFLRRGTFHYNDHSALHQTDRFDSHHIAISDFHSTISLRNYSSDSLNLYIKRMGFVEQSGFELKKITLNLTANKKKASIGQFHILLPETAMLIDSLNVDYSRVKDMRTFADSAFFRLKMQPSTIALRDICVFAPFLQHFSAPILIALNAKGSINNLNGRLSVEGNDNISVMAEASLNGITKPDEAYIFGQIAESKITPAGMSLLINNFSSDNKQLPDILHELGTVHFNGDISGFFSNLVAYGSFDTQLGRIQTDVLLGKNTQTKTFSCKGNLKTSNFAAGRLFGNSKDLQDIAFSMNVDMTKLKNQTPSGKLNGIVSSFDYKGYQYENFELLGSFKGKSFDGSLSLNDPNGKIFLNGMIDLQAKQPVFNFQTSLQNVRLGQLKIAPEYIDSELSCNMKAHFNGRKFDTAQGIIAIDSLSFNNDGESFDIDRLLITAANHENPQQIRIESDLINGQIIGHYAFNSLWKEFIHSLSNVLPVLSSDIEYRKKSEPTSVNNFSFNLKIANTDKLSKTLHLPFTLSKEMNIDGYYDSYKNIFQINGEIPAFTIGKMKFEEGRLLADMPSDKKIQLRINTRKLDKHNRPLALSVNAIGQDGKITSRLDWSNLAATTYSGNINSDIYFTHQKGKYPIRTNIELHPSTLILNDSIWQLHACEVLVDSGKLKISDFGLHHEKQHLKINGSFSKDENDTLLLSLHDMSLDYIFQTINKNYIMFGGKGTGDFFITQQKGTPAIKTDNFRVKDFTYNDVYLGDLSLRSDWDAQHNGIHMNGNIAQKDAEPTLIDGGIFLAQDSIHLKFDAHRLNVGFIHIWTDNILPDIHGRASGQLSLWGKFKELNLTGTAYGENVGFRVDYLNTSYSMSDSVSFSTHGISFKNVNVHDINKETATANGTVSYQHFKDIAYDITILIPRGRKFKVFNVTEKINPLYWGSIYASGSAHIYGSGNKTWIDVSARSSANSDFNFSLNDNLTADDYQFITFRDPELLLQQKNDSITNQLYAFHELKDEKVSSHEMYLNLQMEATPDVMINLIMDPNTGDYIKGYGSGNIRLDYNNINGIRLYGKYQIDKGSYYFNLQDVITRDFTINQGSSVTFRGEPMDATLDIDAIYQISANLTDLDESFAESRELSRTTVPVQCLLNINGDLKKPDLSFDINLPTVSQDIDRQVKSIISTDDMMNRQILYLMVLSKFYTPDYINNGQQQQQNRYGELASVASSTLSSQLNNLLGQISDKWNIGTNIRSDKGDFSDMEVELALSSQLLNNRLLFNGNLGYRDNQTNNTSFIGDFDLEYLLNPAGSIRLKAYNHYNDRNYSIKSSLTTQGVGVMFKRDFNSWDELFRRFRLKKRKTNHTDNNTNKQIQSIRYHD